MANYLKLVLDQEFECTVDGDPVPNTQSNYPGSFHYPVLVNGQAYTLSATAAMHSRIQALGVKKGLVFKVKQTAIPGGKTANKIYNAKGEEINPAGYKPFKSSPKDDPTYQANIEAQWAIGRAIEALDLYKKAGNTVPDSPDGIIMAQAKKFLIDKDTLRDWIVAGKKTTNTKN